MTRRKKKLLKSGQVFCYACLLKLCITSKPIYIGIHNYWFRLVIAMFKLCNIFEFLSFKITEPFLGYLIPIWPHNMTNWHPSTPARSLSTCTGISECPIKSSRGLGYPRWGFTSRSIDERWECLRNNLDNVILCIGQNVMHQLICLPTVDLYEKNKNNSYLRFCIIAFQFYR